MKEEPVPEPDETEDEEDTDDDEEDNDMNRDCSVVIPCQRQDIGGFYAAICAIGTSVEIGTKVS